ncbi:MAG TPA: hypothetical protein VF331_12430 [Polyangiales bacterium]
MSAVTRGGSARRLGTVPSILLLSTLCSSSAAQDAASVHLLDHANHALDPAHDALGVSLAITNDGTLPASFDFGATSRDEHDLRIEVVDAAISGDETYAALSSFAPDAKNPRSELQVALHRAGSGQAFRSQFVRLVGDAVDLAAPGSANRTLLVALRDVLRVRYQGPHGTVEQTLRIGRPGDEDGPLAARLVRLAVHVLRIVPSGPPVIGSDEQSALELVRAEIRGANEIWLQCSLTFGDPAEVSTELADPPPATLLAVADDDGLPAAGGGEIRFELEGKTIGPIATLRGQTPAQTAEAIATAVRAAGFAASVSQNPRTRRGAGPSADVLVHRKDGGFVKLAALPQRAVSTDRRQQVTIGSVDLLDGLEEFDNTTALAGTLEERTLVKALADDDPTTIDLFIVNRFTQATRQGEAFIAASRGAIGNTVILDRQGLRQAALAWTLAHELGHVLLDDPLHPDNIGPDRPWLLMDADNSRGTVNGPKRLRASECERVRSVAKHAKTPLLLPYDATKRP